MAMRGPASPPLAVRLELAGPRSAGRIGTGPRKERPAKQSVIALACRRLDTLYAMLRDGTFYQDPETISDSTNHALTA
ncbi:hypothetical protein GCM10023354_05390 [Garicola koreensis]|uniref:IS110 family transposase n=1 Tax=Garicola koreensis TaxID=1262554 RepID=A0A7W5XZM2_9MICC|nr:hypothetical protein [Garicola koreensis]